MPQDKLIFKPEVTKKSGSVKFVKATPGHCLPLFYKGSIIRIEENNIFEIDTEALGLEAKSQFFKALDEKQITEIGAK